MKLGMATPEDLISNPKKWAFDEGKGIDAFFEQNLITEMVDAFMEEYPHWKKLYLDTHNAPEDIEYILDFIEGKHPCKAIAKIYNYLFTSRETGRELHRLEEIAEEAKAYLIRLEEYDKKYDVDSWNESEFEDSKLGARFRAADAAAKEALTVCHREIGYYHHSQGDIDTGLEYLRKAASSYIDSQSVHQLIRRLVEAEKLDEALCWCSSAEYALLEQTNVRLAKMHAWVHWEREEYDGCITVFDKMIAIDSNDEATKEMRDDAIAMRDGQR